MATKKAKVPTKSELAAMRKRLITAVKAAEKREDAARKRYDTAEAELSYLEECVDEAENDVCDADDDLHDFIQLVEDAEASGDWTAVTKFKPMRW